MTKVSEYLQHFLKRFVPKPTPLNTANHTFLQKIRNPPPAAQNINVHLPQPIPDNFYKAITSEVRGVIDTSPGYYSRQYRFGLESDQNVSTQNITVDLIYPYFEEAGELEPLPAKMDEMFMSCVERIYKWLWIANKHRSSGCSDKLHLWLYMTHSPKLIDVSVGGGEPTSRKHIATIQRKPLNQSNANTAFTYPCTPEGNIFIYREEEWFKVLIHETFHSYNLDFCSNDILATEAQTIIQQTFLRVKGRELRVFETYCETMAEILNIWFQPREFKKRLQIERQFSLFQMVKVLRYMGLSYKDLFVEGEYREDTYIFSYYVLKCICIFHADEFMNWRASEPDLLRIEHTSDCIRAFVGFITERAQRATFVSEVEKMEAWWESHPPGEKIEDLTMRMTVFG